MADTSDSKPADLKNREGSSPSTPTNTMACQHEYVLHMIMMPQGYEKPGASICKHCGEHEPPRQFTAVLTTTQDCTWTEDDEGNWDTQCGEKWCFIEGTPTENHCRFCAYCGGRLVEVRYVEPPIDED
jgi:hypothetical protein